MIPTMEGLTTLSVSLNARVVIDGQPTPYLVSTFSRDVTITTTYRRQLLTFWNNNWQWLWTAGLAPAAAWYLTRKRPGKKRKKR